MTIKWLDCHHLALEAVPVRRLLVIVVALVAVAITVLAAMGSSPAPTWVRVADGAYQVASVCDDGAIVYVPASSRLGPPTVTEDVPAPVVTETEWGIAVEEAPISPEAASAAVDERQAFVYRASASPDADPLALTTVPGGWSARPDGRERFLPSMRDGYAMSWSETPWRPRGTARRGRPSSPG